MKLASLTRIVTQGLFVTMCLPLCHGDSSVLLSKKPVASDDNGSLASAKIIRVIQPGIFDVQTADYIVRMRAWGVSFPKRDQPGYAEALSFTENRLVLMTPELKIKREFDEQNLKVVDILLLGGKMNFSREAIGAGVGWHLEKETNRYGPFVIAQLKAKRMNLGIWANSFNYGRARSVCPTKPPVAEYAEGSKYLCPELELLGLEFGENSQARMFVLRAWKWRAYL